MLLPARIESSWFQDMIFTDPDGWIFVIKGRLSFYNPEKNKNNDPHPIGSILYIRGPIPFTPYHDIKLKIPGRFIQAWDSTI